MVAFLTGETGLRLSIRLIAMPTGGTGSGGVSGVHRHHRNPVQFSLIGDKASQLIKGPFPESFLLALPNRLATRKIP